MGIAIFAAFLYILVAKYGEIIVEDVRLRILGIALGTLALEGVAQHYLPGLLWAFLSVLVVAVLIALTLIHWCKVPKPAALKIVGIFTGVRLAIGIALIVFMAQPR